MLVVATEPESPAEERLEVIEQTENIITAELTNQSKLNWDHGTSYWVEVCLDDVWYAIPTVSGNRGFTMELHSFPPGESETKKSYLDMYGKLPAGKYRINFQGVLAEFEIGYNI